MHVDLRPDLGRVQAQGDRHDRHLARAPHGVYRDRRNALALVNEHRYLAVHPGQKKVTLVRDGYEHREHGDRLLHHRLGLNLLHPPGEGALRESVDGHRGRLSRLHVPDVGFTDQGAQTDLGQVRHVEERRPAARGRRGRGNHLSGGDGLVQNGPFDGSAHGGILAALPREIEVRPRLDERGLSVGVIERGALVLIGGDDLANEEIVGALLLDE